MRVSVVFWIFLLASLNAFSGESWRRSISRVIDNEKTCDEHITEKWYPQVSKALCDTGHCQSRHQFSEDLKDINGKLLPKLEQSMFDEITADQIREQACTANYLAAFDTDADPTLSNKLSALQKLYKSVGKESGHNIDDLRVHPHSKAQATQLQKLVLDKMAKPLSHLRGLYAQRNEKLVKWCQKDGKGVTSGDIFQTCKSSVTLAPIPVNTPYCECQPPARETEALDRQIRLWEASIPDSQSREGNEFIYYWAAQSPTFPGMKNFAQTAMGDKAHSFQTLVINPRKESLVERFDEINGMGRDYDDAYKRRLLKNGLARPYMTGSNAPYKGLFSELVCDTSQSLELGDEFFQYYLGILTSLVGGVGGLFLKGLTLAQQIAMVASITGMNMGNVYAQSCDLGGLKSFTHDVCRDYGKRKSQEELISIVSTDFDNGQCVVGEILAAASGALMMKKTVGLALARNPAAKVIAGELASAGQLAKPGDFSKLPVGRYVYIVTSDGETYWSNEVPNLAPGEGDRIVSSHRSLFAKATELRGGKPPTIISAGEVIRDEAYNHKTETMEAFTSEVNNHSKTFQGDARNLAVGLDHLKKNGLDVQKRTFFGDYSKILRDRHANAGSYGSNMVGLTDTKEATRQEVVNRITDFRNKLIRLFPDGTNPNTFDSAPLMRRLEEMAATIDPNDPKAGTKMYEFMQIKIYIDRIKDGPMFGALATRSTTDLDRYYQTLKEIVDAGLEHSDKIKSYPASAVEPWLMFPSFLGAPRTPPTPKPAPAHKNH